MIETEKRQSAILLAVFLQGEIRMEKKETIGKTEILLTMIIRRFAFVVIRDAFTVVLLHILMIWRYTIAVIVIKCLSLTGFTAGGEEKSGFFRYWK